MNTTVEQLENLTVGKILELTIEQEVNDYLEAKVGDTSMSCL